MFTPFQHHGGQIMLIAHVINWTWNTNMAALGGAKPVLCGIRSVEIILT